MRWSPILVGYGVGSLPLGYLVASRLKGIDLRRVGSGNVGAANVYRTAGLATALLVVLVDVAKGAGSVLARVRASAAGAARPVPRAWPRSSGTSIPCGCASAAGKASRRRAACSAMLAPLATAHRRR